jgi:ribosome-binding protein aMBF1 (putative translation factor)
MKFIPVSELAKKWLKDPAFRREYDALEEEFALFDAMMTARGRAGLTQAQVAKRMKTTQTAVARLESGRVKPSTRTLERYAHATGHRLVIGFEPLKRAGTRTARSTAAPAPRKRSQVRA